MNLFQKLCALLGRDYVLLDCLDEWRVRRVRWCSGYPTARSQNGLPATAVILLAGGGVKGGHGYVKGFLPITERIRSWSEVTSKFVTPDQAKNRAENVLVTDAGRLMRIENNRLIQVK